MKGRKRRFVEGKNACCGAVLTKRGTIPSKFSQQKPALKKTKLTLQLKLRKQLMSGQFRFVNERLYTTTSTEVSLTWPSQMCVAQSKDEWTHLQHTGELRACMPEQKSLGESFNTILIAQTLHVSRATCTCMWREKNLLDNGLRGSGAFGSCTPMHSPATFTLLKLLTSCSSSSRAKYCTRTNLGHTNFRSRLKSHISVGIYFQSPKFQDIFSLYRTQKKFLGQN